VDQSDRSVSNAVRRTDTSFVLDLDQSWGRAAMALAITAQVTGQPLLVSGTNTCSIVFNIETWSWGHLTQSQ
jgi:hypothetical protein